MSELEDAVSLDDFSELDRESYEEALYEAAGWMEMKGEELAYPGTWKVPDLAYDFGYRGNWHDVHEAIVKEVVQQRRNAMHEGDIAPREPDGRILAVGIDESLSDGAGPSVTDEFLCRGNLPPTDTWITYFVEPSDTEDTYPFTHWEVESGAVLLSYIPSELVETVQAGIDVNPEKCLAWVEE